MIHLPRDSWHESQRVCGRELQHSIVVHDYSLVDVLHTAAHYAHDGCEMRILRRDDDLHGRVIAIHLHNADDFETPVDLHTAFHRELGVAQG